MATGNLTTLAVLALSLAFVSGASANTIHVDDDALNDPGPGDPAVSDPLEDGSAEHPFDAIQEGIDQAVDGDEVVVADGLYTGDGNFYVVDFDGKAITLRSANGPETCVVDCEGHEHGLLFWNGETTSSVLDGFTIRNCHGGNGGAVSCWNSSPTITNCSITGNSAGEGGAGIDCYDNSSPMIANCVITGNTGGWGGGGIACGSSTTITNCTITRNTVIEGGSGIACGPSTTITNCIVWGNAPNQIAGSPTVRYCDVQGGWAGDGNINADPLFVPGPAGCFYLSQTGAGQAVDSPCVDTGSDTAVNLGLDTLTTRSDEVTDTGIVDMGYHYPVTGLPLLMGDYDRDLDVDLADFAELQNCFTGEGPSEVSPCCRIFDFEPDDDVDLDDYALFQGAFAETCGNGVIEQGEQCEPPNTDTCDEYCQTIGGSVANDSCSSPTMVVDGTTISITNQGATTDGPDEPTACDFFGYTHVESDVWYCYTATCTDLVTVSLCGSSYDTKVAVYHACECPTQAAFACSDDNCGIGSGSRVQFMGIAGEDYLIRVGGFDGAQGDGFMTILCGTPPSCTDGEGDCFADNGSPACDDEECCEAVCAVDQYCCDVTWDDWCAGEAEGLCGGIYPACVDGTGDCFTAHGTAGCDDETCCQSVCLFDPYCCLMEWDDTCVAEANERCGDFLICGLSTESCLVPHRDPGCSDGDCCREVCSQIPDCCLVEWTPECVDAANAAPDVCR